MLLNGNIRRGVFEVGDVLGNKGDSLKIELDSGKDRIRDEGLLASALAKPKNLHTYNTNVDIFSLAAAYGFCITKNHPFADGNKRTGYVVMNLFLALHGTGILASNDNKYKTIMQLASCNMTEEELTGCLRKNAV